MLGTASLRVLDARDSDAVAEVLSRDPVTDVFVAGRVAAAGCDPSRLGGELWGYLVDGRLEALCHVAANLVPVQAGPAAVAAFAERAGRQGRRSSTVLGPSGAVVALWDLLAPVWGPARDIRRDQPFLVATRPPPVPVDTAVRRVRPDEIDLLLPASVAMYTEEVGVSPVAGGTQGAYRARLAELIKAGRAFARIEHGQVVFKAELGSVTPHACQVQGVWVPPQLRGRGLSKGGMAAVVAACLESVAPVVTLYVNDYNAPARAAYARVGFEQQATFMSVLF